MAFVPTLLGTATDTNTTTTVVTGTLSPTANSLLVVACTMGGSQTTDFTFASIVDTFVGTGTWTQYTISGVDATSTRYYRTAVFVAKAGSAPLTGTVTVTASANNNRKDIAVYEVTTGYNTTTPVKQSQTGEGEASTLVLTLGATPDTDSMVFAAIGAAVEASGITPGTNFTELDEVDAGNLNQQTQYDVTSATTTADWSALSARQHTGVAIEIDAASGGSSISPSISPSVSPSSSISPSASPSVSPSSSISPSVSPSSSISPSVSPSVSPSSSISPSVSPSSSISPSTSPSVSPSSSISPSVSPSVSPSSSISPSVSPSSSLSPSVSPSSSISPSLSPSVSPSSSISPSLSPSTSPSLSPSVSPSVSPSSSISPSISPSVSPSSSISPSVSPSSSISPSVSPSVSPSASPSAAPVTFNLNRNYTFKIHGKLGTQLKKWKMPTWSTSGRPSGKEGLYGLNTETGKFEIFNGSIWVGIALTAV